MKLFPSLVACLLLAVAAFGVSAAAAQEANPNANQDANHDQDARAHFRRAIEQFNEENFDAALAEFQRAYAIDPANAILYNIARVYAGQGNAVEAARNYERYLRDGGPDLLPERRAEVEAALETQRSRIGHIEVVVSVDGATIAIDGADVATSPLYEPLAVSAGTVDIEVRAPNHTDVRRRVTVAGGSVERVEVEMQEAVQPGILRIESEVPGVVIEIDGRHVGETPLNASISLPVGDHRVVARRPGYRSFEEDFHTSQNSRAEIVLEMRPDPFAAAEDLGVLVLGLPDADYEARIDGQAMNQAGLRALPVGRHRIELVVEDRLPFRGTVNVEGGGET
ncbi:MAG: hypothetical protein DRJ42_15505, partial [Deltaproteobacteria bacterium]